MQFSTPDNQGTVLFIATFIPRVPEESAFRGLQTSLGWVYSDKCRFSTKHSLYLGNGRRQAYSYGWKLIGSHIKALYLVQWGADWVWLQPTQAPPRCTKCDSPPINSQSRSVTILLYGQLRTFKMSRIMLSWELLLRSNRNDVLLRNTLKLLMLSLGAVISFVVVHCQSPWLTLYITFVLAI